MGSVKTGVAIPEEVMKEFEDLARTLGYGSRSRAFQDAVQLFIATNRWVESKGYVAGCIVVIYDHEEHGVEDSLTNIQHSYLKIVSAAMHVHLSNTKCMLIIALKGDVETVRKLYSELSKVRGITHIQAAFTTLVELNKE